MPTPEPLAGKHATAKKDGQPLDVESLRWAVEPRGGEDRYASDKTEGHRVAWTTINDYNATWAIKVPKTGTVPFNRGDVFPAQFHIDNTGSNYLGGSVIVLAEPLTVDIGDEKTIELEYSLGPRGPLVYYGILWGGSGSSGIPNSGC